MAKDKGKDGKEEKLSRAEVFARCGHEPILPDVSHSDLPEMLSELGYVGAGGFGPVTLSFAEIEAYGRCQGLDLTPEEALMLNAMSGAVIAGQNAEEPPYLPIETRRAYSGLKSSLQFG